MKKNFLSENIKNILISAIGAFTCMLLIAYFNSIDKTNFWLIPPFGGMDAWEQPEEAKLNLVAVIGLFPRNIATHHLEPCL